jgi:hypothetical protein
MTNWIINDLDLYKMDDTIISYETMSEFYDNYIFKHQKKKCITTKFFKFIYYKSKY